MSGGKKRRGPTAGEVFNTYRAQIRDSRVSEVDKRDFETRLMDLYKKDSSANFVFDFINFDPNDPTLHPGLRAQAQAQKNNRAIFSDIINQFSAKIKGLEQGEETAKKIKKIQEDAPGLKAQTSALTGYGMGGSALTK